MISMNFEYNSCPTASNFPYHVLPPPFLLRPFVSQLPPSLYYSRLQFDKKDYWFNKFLFLYFQFSHVVGSSFSRELCESWLQLMIHKIVEPFAFLSVQALIDRYCTLFFGWSRRYILKLLGFLREVEVFLKPLRKDLKVVHIFSDTLIH